MRVVVPLKDFLSRATAVTVPGLRYTLPCRLIPNALVALVNGRLIPGVALIPGLISSSSLMMPQPPAEVTGLVALMLLHDARRDARVDQAGDIIVLGDQDRSRWDHRQIAEALLLVTEALRGRPGPFSLQAAIAAVHCQATRADETDWPQIVRLYDLLERVQPSPIVSLNRAVAVAMAEGAEAGLNLIDQLAATDDLSNYHLLYAARADLLRRLGSAVESAKSYQRALALVTNEALAAP